MRTGCRLIALITYCILLSACLTVSPKTCNTSMTDNDITTTVQVRYASDTGLHYQNLHVSTYERVVTLSGTVENPTQANIALVLAQTTPNVKRVISHIKVRRIS